VTVGRSAALSATPAKSPAAGASLPGVEAFLTIYRSVASRLKRHPGLFPAPGTYDRCAS
jgi:hypothetical protein